MDALLEVFTLQGRANRAWYFWHIVLDDVAILMLIVTLVLIGGVLQTPAVLLPIFGVILAGVWAGIAVTVKRLHDLGRPGSHWWLLLIPIYNVYLGLVLLFGKGTPGPNRFGPDPLSIARASAHVGERLDP